ncbi:uncharacterized protein LOC119955019 [Scyliorhinus canicula]|uniref:uncharacterized protein LOC119955019 n=1 Tax=Scyliorhinus canicula TaxID=7830 RepID=UPI0018F2FEF9|nr:uncharacterized protein LOC119955019 [Scyliorhinus canicula]
MERAGSALAADGGMPAPGESEVWMLAKCSPLPRRRSSSSDEEPPPAALNRKVSFADAFGLELVSVREFDRWGGGEVAGSPLPGGPVPGVSLPLPPDPPPLLPLFQLPADPAELLREVRAHRVQLESAGFPPGAPCLAGVVRVLNLAYEKRVWLRLSADGWDSHRDIPAQYAGGSPDGQTDRFAFRIALGEAELRPGARLEFAICYQTPAAQYWANNHGGNFVLESRGPGETAGPEQQDDRNLKSCLKTSPSKEMLDTPSDDGCMMLPNTEDMAQQANRAAILETDPFSEWNMESLFDKNTEQKEEKSKQEPDPQINPPWHISLTTSRDQETNLTLIDGSHSHVKEENEKNAVAISESPISQQNDIDVEYNKFASVNDHAENEVKQENESVWVKFRLDNLSTQSHEGSINATGQADSANVVASNDNTMTQFSHLFCDEAHLLHEGSLPLSQGSGEAVTPHVIDTSAEPELGWNSFSGSNTEQNNLVIIQGAIDKCGKPPTNVQNHVDALQEATNAGSGSGENAYLTGNTLLKNETESIAGSTVRTNADMERQPDRSSPSVHSSISSKLEMILRAKIGDTHEPLKYYSRAENSEGLKQDDFSEKTILTKEGAESIQEQNAIKRAPQLSSKEKFSDHSEIGREVTCQVSSKEENSCGMYSNDRRFATDTTGIIEFTQYTTMHGASDKEKHHNLGKELEVCLQIVSSEQLQVTNVPDIETAAKATEFPVLQGPSEDPDPDPCEASKILVQIPEIHSTNRNTANGEKDNAVASAPIAERSVSAPSCMLADAVVKEAIEAALFEITGDEGRITTSISQKEKDVPRLPSGEKISEFFPLSTAFHLTSKHEQPLQLYITHGQNAKGVSELGDCIVPKMNIVCAQMGEDVPDTPQKNTAEEAAPMENLCTRTSVPSSEDIKYPCSYGQSLEVAPRLTDFKLAVENQSEATITAYNGEDVTDSTKAFPDRQEGRLSCKITDTNESIPENIFESVGPKITDNGEGNQADAEIAKQLAINLAELPEEKARCSENETAIDFTQSSNVSEMDFQQNYRVLDADEPAVVGKAELNGEEATSIKNILQHFNGTDESRSTGFAQLHKVTSMSQTIKEAVSAPEQRVKGEVDHETSMECEAVDTQECGTDNEVMAESEREKADIFPESIDAHSLETIELCHGTQQVQIDESMNQNAVRPQTITKISSTPHTSNDTRESKCRNTILPQNSESCSHHKHLGPIILISTPIEEDELREPNSKASRNIHPYTEGLESGEYNEKILGNEQASEASDGSGKREESWLQSEPFADEITLKNTVWKVCCSVLFVVFLVTVYHYDFMGCFALYLFSLYWLYCEGEKSTDSVKKE